MENHNLIKDDRDKFDHSSAAAFTDESYDKFAVFERWLLENGTKIPKLELRDYGNEVRGCHTREDIIEEEIIIEVPLKCLITVEMGKETEVGKAILNSNLELDAPKHIFLMVFMLIDMKKSDSFFRPYYEILPKTLSNMPIFWEPHEMKYLEGSYLIEQIEERNIAIENDYEAICSLVPEFRHISTLHEFKWARMCVCSRNFGLVINGIQTAALVPYADMLNHYRPRETKWQFDDTLQSFTVVSLQTIMNGSQVYDSYGRKCNHRFLLNYGFSVENNIEADGYCPNEVPVVVELKKNDPLFELKCSYYRRDLSIPSRRIRISVSDNDNTKLLLAFLRLIEADNEDFDILISSSNSSLYRSIRDAQIPISTKNELKSMLSLEKVCIDALQLYPTTFEQDCNKLKYDNVPLFSNERNALIQIKGEKEVLLFYKEFATVAINLLKSKDLQEFDELINDIRLNKHTFIFQYCRGVVGRLIQEEFRKNDFKKRTPIDLSRPTIV